jgi:F0F1-type ATP synthase membrane subunit b/b'
MAIAEKVVERQLTQNDQDNLVSEFIDQLGDAL